MEGGDEIRDIEYLRGLEAAVSSGVEYALEIVAHGGAESSPLPLPVLSQARMAARHRIPLKLVIRRYLAAKSVLNDFVFRTAAEPPIVHSPAVHEVAAAHNVAFDQLVSSVSVEYEREESARSTNRPTQRFDLIQRLLRGEPMDASSLGYSFAGYHLGLVILSRDPQPLLRSLSRDVDARLLLTRSSDSATWAWLGGSEAPDLLAVSHWVNKHWSTTVPLGIGEVTQFLSGWRRTHNQAQAAAHLAHLRSEGVTRYRDVALLCAACRDPLLLESMDDMYLSPLAQAGDRAEEFRATLSAFFAADRNASSAASALGVSRQTISNRLSAVEERLRQPLGACGDLLRAALQLEQSGTFHQLDKR